MPSHIANLSDELNLAESPRLRTRNAGTKRNYKTLNDGPVNAEVLRDAHRERVMRRARAALPRDPNEPPRKRGRPRKERPLMANGSLPTTPSDKSTTTQADAGMRHYFNTNRLDSASDEEKEWADNMKTFRTSPPPSPTSSPRKRSVAAMDIGGSNICYRYLMNTVEEPVKFHSPAEDVAALFLAVVEQGRLEMAEEKARTEAAVKAGLATFNGRLKAAVRAGLVAAEKAKAESAKRARQEASEKARLEEAEAARQEAAERARQDAAVKAWLEEAENAKRAAAQAARIARNSNKARRTKNSKRAQKHSNTQMACSRRKGSPQQAIRQPVRWVSADALATNSRALLARTVPHWS